MKPQPAPRPTRRAAVALALLLAAAGGPASGQTPSHPALAELIPLVEVYGIAVTPTPAFDIAGIRCAGLFGAQRSWAEAHGRRGMPSAARLRDIDLNLDRARITRHNAGMDLSRAHSTTQQDVYTVSDLYTRRFRSRDGGEGLPWQGDGLITSDTAYCDILNGRR